MATLNVPQNGKAVKGRTRKPIIGVDLTAMVDLAFLLITFFMLTTSLGKMNAMELAKPDDAGIQEPWPASRTLTVLLGKDNKVVYYLGEVTKNPMKVADFASLRKVILDSKARVAKTHENIADKEMYVIVKPTSTAVYRNFVDILDEININKITTYAIDDKYILDEEVAFMKYKGI